MEVMIECGWISGDIGDCRDRKERWGGKWEFAVFFFPLVLAMSRRHHLGIWSLGSIVTNCNRQCQRSHHHPTTVDLQLGFIIFDFFSAHFCHRGRVDYRGSQHWVNPLTHPQAPSELCVAIIFIESEQDFLIRALNQTSCIGVQGPSEFSFIVNAMEQKIWNYSGRKKK